MHLHSTDFYWQLVKPVILLLPLILVTCCQMCQFAGPRSAGSLTLPQPRLHVSFSKQHNGWSHRRDSTSSSYLLTPVNSVHCSRLWILSVSENHADSEMTERRKCVCKKHYCDYFLQWCKFKAHIVQTCIYWLTQVKLWCGLIIRDRNITTKMMNFEWLLIISAISPELAIQIEDQTLCNCVIVTVYSTLSWKCTLNVSYNLNAQEFTRNKCVIKSCI